MQIEQINIENLLPYARNSRTHSDEQTAQIAASIKEFGFTNPVLIDNDNQIIAGHGRVLAARKLKMKDVPCIRLGYLTETQKRAYVIADNKLALNSGWDEELLALEIAELQNDDFDVSLLGFSDEELKDLGQQLVDEIQAEYDESKYTKKIDAPIYKPEGPKPEIAELFDKTQYSKLVEAIESNKDIPDDERSFLLYAASRHIIFNFQAIAEYYAHSNETVQSLMEESALVIIDFDKAIQLGYVKLSKNMSEIYASEKEGVDNDEE